jgi:putative pyruvate formate lyase activating enzyme
VDLAGSTLANVDEAALWSLHDAAVTAPPAAAPPTTSLLDVKTELAQRLLAPCRLCWLGCPVDRTAGERGRCGLGAGLPVYRDFVHLGEELELIPTHAVYLAGCNYRCAYCSEWDHVDRPGQHAEVDPQRLAASIDARRREGALSVSFVGGLPDVNLPGILRALQAARESVPVVWNSNMSASPEAMRLLHGVVDCYVADLKYGSESCARTGSAVEGSLAVVHANLRQAAEQTYLIVRHLVLPDHVDCCTRPALRWLAEHTPQARINLMPHYQPTPQVRGTAWDRLPTADELAQARAEAEGLGLILLGPGRQAPRTPAPAQGRALPVADFESKIRFDAEGRIVIEDLDPQLADLARELGLAAELDDRGDAAGPWLQAP